MRVVAKALNEYERAAIAAVVDDFKLDVGLDGDELDG